MTMKRVGSPRRLDVDRMSNAYSHDRGRYARRRASSSSEKRQVIHSSCFPAMSISLGEGGLNCEVIGVSRAGSGGRGME